MKENFRYWYRYGYNFGYWWDMSDISIVMKLKPSIDIWYCYEFMVMVSCIGICMNFGYRIGMDFQQGISISIGIGLGSTPQPKKV